jgi:hypothetical protein
MGNPTQSDELDERGFEATDDETLDKIEDAFGDEENAPEDQLNVPSPDGSFDADDELEQADPL